MLKYVRVSVKYKRSMKGLESARTGTKGDFSVLGISSESAVRTGVGSIDWLIDT